MTPLAALLLAPLAGMLLLAATGHRRLGAPLNILVSALTLWAAWALAVQVQREGAFLAGHGYFYIDAFNVWLLLLTAFVGLTTALFSWSYMQHERDHRQIGPTRMRLYHASYQAFVFAMLLAQSTDNLGILWVAMEAATLATVLLVSLYGTPESVEAAWKYFILCGVGIAQALFGSVLVFFAAERVIPNPEDALSWHLLYQHAGQLEPVVLTLAFVFALVGYGTKVGLVPLHNWLPDAHSQGPTPLSAVLSGLLLHVALYAVIRVKMLVDGSLQTPLAGHLLMGFGLVSFLVAALFLHRQKDIKRMYSYSSIEHMGLMTFAFGVGGPLATFAGLLHMTAHSLTKSALFASVGQAIRIAGTQAMAHIRGLIRTQPKVGWALLLGTAAIAGFPPFGVFTGEFLILMATMKTWPRLTGTLLVGLAVAFAGLFRNVQPMVYGAVPEGQHPIRVSVWPVYLHLALVLWLGLSIPPVLAQWFDQATRLISGGSLP